MHQKLSPGHGARQVDRLGEDECDDYANNDYYNLGQGNFPPAEVPVPHPNCLCIQTAVIPKSLDEIGEEIGDWLRSANNPNLDNCFNNLSKNKDEIAVSKDDNSDIINNNDIKEYNIFKNALGKEAPKTFKNFQKIKYNKAEEWKELKYKYQKFKDKDLAIFTEDLPIPPDRKNHVWLGENKFGNPKMPEKGGGVLNGGGHGQGAIDLLEEHYNLVIKRYNEEKRKASGQKLSNKKEDTFKKAFQRLGFEYKEYENGVRLGNIFGTKGDDKRINWGQAWFPKDWTEEDIYEAGQYVLKISDKNLFDSIVVRDGNIITKIDKYAEYKGITIGVINYKDGKPYIGTIFPDKAFRFNKDIKEKKDSYYKKGERIIMYIDLIDIAKTKDIIEIINGYRMKIESHHDDLLEKFWNRCVEIMSEDEDKAIQFIKDNYNSKYRNYIEEIFEVYCDKSKSKKFVMEMWDFFKNTNEECYKDALILTAFYNDWDEEEWLDIP
ncbi:EndoU domain-containing protein [uncultured Clostridium sp.]|uniref:EndoU domain-containing protein n=6 Tax=uncultured Clostridium sp. TaxID=59620 RepID=UPI00261A0F71|nr:EndoU domain-containing protein [uncultured Clostridium sp.]